MVLVGSSSYLTRCLPSDDRITLGVLARELIPYTKRIVGVDISPGVIDKFNSNSRHLGLPTEKIQGHCVKLKGKEGELDNQKFDVILVGPSDLYDCSA